ncbi:calcium-dependent protein kinase 29, partial [Phtheirospermum japonicum]
YILGAQLCLGKFGIIRECADKSICEILACKSIAKERLVTEDDVRSREARVRILTKLSGHDNVVDLKAMYEDDDHVHLLMELCAGGELFHLIEKQGNFSEHEASVVFKQLMEVVMYCHDKGIVHRDLKPENNLLVLRSSSSSPIKLADFGLATHIEPGNLFSSCVHCYYMQLQHDNYLSREYFKCCTN